MPSIIFFPALDGSTAMNLNVKQEVSEVHDAFISAEGLPFRLTTDDDREVWINPANVAFWMESSGRAPQFDALG
jgi:hypothetical protein